MEAYLRQQLFTTRGYPTDKVQVLDAYPDAERMARPLDRNYVAVGYTFDDGGKPAELGSTLKRRLHTIDFHVFGTTRVWGRNLATIIRSSLESDGTINLINPADSSVLGFVSVDFVSTQQAPVPEPRPWLENVWVTRLRVEDFYSSAGGGG